MQILIPLPQSSSANTYQELKSYLKQLELAVHHAQKSVESAEKEGVEITEDSSISFEHPLLEKIDIHKNNLQIEILEDFECNFYDELQNIQLRINLE